MKKQLIEEIFRQHYSPLCNYAAKILNDGFAAEDIVQALFIDLYEKNKWYEIRNLEMFLLKSVKFRCIDHLRKLKNSISETEISDNNFDQQFDIKEEDIEPLFHYYAAKLPPKTREVFLLSRSKNFSNKEIAKELNISVKTVENQMSRALKKMKELLKDFPVLLTYL